MNIPTPVGYRRPKLQELALSVVSVSMVLAGERPLVDAVVVVGIGVMAPLALGSSAWWIVAGPAAALALRLDPGWLATAFVLPASIAALRSLVRSARSADRRRPEPAAPGSASGPGGAADVLAASWTVVAMISLMASTAGLELFGIGEPIVRLTAVHYLYAGTGALVLATRLRREGGRCRRLAASAVVATAVAPPVVAAGFVLTEALPQIGGAALMTVGVWSSAVVLLAGAWPGHDTTRRPLRIIAGVTPWIPMVLAVAWAAAQHISGVPALSVPDMARFHGLANGVGFVLVGLLATAPRVPASPAIGSPTTIGAPG